VGDSGVLRAENGLTVERPINIELRREDRIEEAEQVSNQDAYTRQVESFADAVEGKREFPVPGEQGWQNQEVLDAAYRSITSGKTETVPLVIGR